MSLDGKGAPSQVLRRGRSGPKGPLTENSRAWRVLEGFKAPLLTGKRLRNCPRQPKKARKGSELSGRSLKRSAQKCPESVREEPNKALKLSRDEPKRGSERSGKSPKRRRNCPGGAF